MQSMEILLSKLMSLEVFNDGVKFHVANRVNAPLFRVTAGFGDLVGALVTAAAQPPDPVPN